MRVEQIVADRLDVMERLGPPVDLVEMFASVVPSLVACAVFGIPESSRSIFEGLADVRRNPSATIDDILQANEGFTALAQELVEGKRAQPTPDLLSEVIHKGKMADNELVSTIAGMLMAAYLGVARNIAFAVASLLKDRDRWDKLTTEPDSTAQIVEELLRHAVNGTVFVRTALEDVELGGAVIKAFETVVISGSAANRDPHVFAEPDRVCPMRQSAAPHLSFGYGVHQCLGQHLGRLQLQLALTGLARRFPKLDLAVAVEDILWHRDASFYAPQRLPVTW